MLTKGRQDRLILAMIPPKNTLADTLAEVLRHLEHPNTRTVKETSSDFADAPVEDISKYACLFPAEKLEVPKIDLNVLREYREIYNIPVKAKSPKVNGYWFVLAKQNIRFTLNESGAKLVSEAVGGLFGSGMEEHKTRNFTFDRPFLVMLMRKGAMLPYFAAWIHNEELLVHTPADEEATTQDARPTPATMPATGPTSKP